MRYVLLTLALAGVIVSALALQVHYSNETQPCDINEKWDCGKVNQSPFAEVGGLLSFMLPESARGIVNHIPFSEIAGIPVAVLGIVGYLAIGVLSFCRLRALAFLFAIVAFGFALYLSHIEKDVLQTWCVYCVISQSLIAIILLLSGGWYFWARNKLHAT